MKRLFISFLAIVALCVTAISFHSCKEEPKYTVWIDTISHAEYQAITQQFLTDGYFHKTELTTEQWETFVESTTSDQKQSWTEKEIKNWMADHGFGESMASSQAAWLVQAEHSYILWRNGSDVHYILK